MKTILLTGGTGFIGSHVCISLLQKGYKLIVIDSLVNSSKNSLEGINKIVNKSISNLSEKLIFEEGDIRNKDFLNMVFEKAFSKNNKIHAVIHFAGLKSVGESVKYPLLYWDTNVVGSLKLFEVMEKFNCRNIVFSSSATVYGDASSKPIDESFEIKPKNPYGFTKAAIENILMNIFQSSENSWRIANLRYFNPIGAHESGLIGEESCNMPNNIFPYICKVAKGYYDKINIFGNDWPTKDGTGIRDYVHIMDLADAHCAALKYLLENNPQYINLNIGTGVGTSVLELINKFQVINNCKVPIQFIKRRKGDSPIVVADNKLSLSKLKWVPKKSLNDMCRDGWRWEMKNS